MCYPMGVFWTRTRPSFKIIHVMWLHLQWLQMSLHSLCLLFMKSLVLRILLCIPRCFHLLHDGIMNFSSGLDTALWHHSSWTGLPFLLSYFFMAGRFCINDFIAFIIIFFVLKFRHLFFRTSLHSSLLVGNYVCNISYKSNAFIWLETFHKEYWQVLMH